MSQLSNNGANMFGNLLKGDTRKEKRNKVIENLEDQVFQTKLKLKEAEHELENKAMELTQKENKFDIQMKRKEQEFELSQEKKEAKLEIKLNRLEKELEDSQESFEKEKTKLEEEWKTKYEKDIALFDLSKQQELAKLKNHNEK